MVLVNAFVLQLVKRTQIALVQATMESPLLIALVIDHHALVLRCGSHKAEGLLKGGFLPPLLSELPHQSQADVWVRVWATSPLCQGGGLVGDCDVPMKDFRRNAFMHPIKLPTGRQVSMMQTHVCCELGRSLYAAQEARLQASYRAADAAARCSSRYKMSVGGIFLSKPVILASVYITGTLVIYRQPQLVLDGFQELRCVGHGRDGKLNSLLK